jgi:CMP-N,N'-diacetyllegionaminic acid synthase
LASGGGLQTHGSVAKAGASHFWSGHTSRPVRILALIPARGGSKGIPRKNVRLLAGRPLIEHSILAARAAPSVTDVVCSTEDEEIAAIAANAGARVPFRRPLSLATDDVPTSAVVLHTVHTLAAAGGRYDAILLLQPTAPLRKPEDIEGAIRRFIETGADSVISVTPAGAAHPYYSYRLEQERAIPFLIGPAGMRRQDFPAAFVRNGAIYLAQIDVLLRNQSFYGTDMRAYVMPPERSVNIDEPFDWQLAELLMSQRPALEPDAARPQR